MSGIIFVVLLSISFCALVMGEGSTSFTSGVDCAESEEGFTAGFPSLGMNTFINAPFISTECLSSSLTRMDMLRWLVDLEEERICDG